MGQLWPQPNMSLQPPIPAACASQPKDGELSPTSVAGITGGASDTGLLCTTTGVCALAGWDAGGSLEPGACAIFGGRPWRVAGSAECGSEWGGRVVVGARLGAVAGSVGDGPLDVGAGDGASGIGAGHRSLTTSLPETPLRAAAT
jgi:hypothetical protein